MDLNGDGKIGIKDLNMLLKGWNTTYTSNKDTLKNDIVTNWGHLYVKSWKSYSYEDFYNNVTSQKIVGQVSRNNEVLEREKTGSSPPQTSNRPEKDYYHLRVKDFVLVRNETQLYSYNDYTLYIFNNGQVPSKNFLENEFPNGNPFHLTDPSVTKIWYFH